MSIKVNGTDIGSSIKLNNTDLSEIIFNGVSVWTAAPAIYDIVKNATGNITESQWLEFVNEGCIKIAIDKGEATLFIGKNVTINNSNDYSSKSWKIADFNHDNSGNTCDLIFNNVAGVKAFNTTDNVYRNSSSFKWLRDTYLNGFSVDIKNKLTYMPVSTNGSTVYHQIKLLSGTEVGLSHSNMLVEGTQYPIFTDNNSRKRTSEGAYWWLRSKYTDNSGSVWVVNPSGTLNTMNYNNNERLIPCISFY